MQKYEFIASDLDAGERLDVFLVKQLGNQYSRTFIKKMIDNKNVTISGSTPKANHSVSENEKITVEFLPPEPVMAKPEDIPLDIVYEDEDIAVINKQVGLVVHPAPGHYEGTLVNALLHHSGDLSGIGGKLRPGIVHRLDKDTTGLIVIAKNDNAHKDLSEQFRNKTAGRVYTAVVKGVVQLDNGVIDAPIGRDTHDRKRKAVVFDGSGREARTVYSVFSRKDNFTVLTVKLGTGRTHQIRVHMAYLGHPIIGDKTYGCKKGLDRQALHAGELSFTHPRTGKNMSFKAALPDDIKKLVEKDRF